MAGRAPFSARRIVFRLPMSTPDLNA